MLVVDDEASIADALAAILRAAGYRALVAYHGSEALSVVAHEKVDVVVTDLVMSGMDGATLLRWLRSDPATCDVPVILMSMLAESRAFALCSGYAKFLRKPLQSKALIAAIEEVCEAIRRPVRGAGASALQGFVH